jgi:hypothetical protein
MARLNRQIRPTTIPRKSRVARRRARRSWGVATLSNDARGPSAIGRLSRFGEFAAARSRRNCRAVGASQHAPPTPTRQSCSVSKTNPSCWAKSWKSLALSVRSGSPWRTQHAATHVSFCGRGRPRRWALAASRPHTRATSGSYGITGRRAIQRWRRRRAGSPQLRTSAHLANSATVMNVNHTRAPAMGR